MRISLKARILQMSLNLIRAFAESSKIEAFVWRYCWIRTTSISFNQLGKSLKLLSYTVMYNHIREAWPMGWLLTRGRLFHLRSLREFKSSPQILRDFDFCIIESFQLHSTSLTGTETTGQDLKALYRIVHSAEHSIGGALPCLKEIYTKATQQQKH